MRTARGDSDRNESGFTLIELMVVVMIIAVLLAVAIPTLLGARTRAQDRAAQSNARNAVTAELVLFTDAQRFSEDPIEMGEVDPSLEYTQALADLVPSGPVYIELVATATPDDTILVGTRSASGTCFWLRRAANTDVPSFAANTCAATPAAADFGPGWS